MAEDTAEQQASRSFKCARRHYLVVLTVCAFLCFASGVATLDLVLVLFCPTCRSPNSLSVWIYGTVAVLLFLLAVLISLITVRYKRWLNGFICGSTPEVDFPTIPAENLENFDGALLPPAYNHVFRRFSLVEVSSIHLPDYFTAVQSTENINSSDVPDIPPPCYEEVVEMTTSRDA